MPYTNEEAKQKVRETFLAFDLDASTDDALDAISASAGIPTGHEQVDEDLMGLDEAMRRVQFRETPEWQQISETIELHLNEYDTKSKKDGVAKDERLANLDKAEALRKLKAAINLVFDEATDRLKKVNGEDALRLGSQGMQIVRGLQQAPASTGQFAEAHPAPKFTAEQIRDNTERSIRALDGKK